MNYLKVFSFLFAVLISSCQENQNGEYDLKRKYRISEKNMVEILCEIHLLEESTKQIRLRKDEKNQFAKYYYQQLFEKYNTDKDLFAKNLKYYQQDLENFDKMYGKVIEKLSRLQENEDTEKSEK